MTKAIDDDYFKHYAGNTYSYDSMYQYHSGINMCLDLLHWAIPEVKSVYVFGSATGRVLEDFAKAGLKTAGCEINEWAYKQTAEQHKANVTLGDMRLVVPKLVAGNKHFDLIFSNSLVYLPENEIPGFLTLCHHLCDYFHFYSSFEGYACNDEYRVTLKPYNWWAQQFKNAGFEMHLDIFLWKKV